ncbi:hypothetical protein LUZ60_016370 [Juncus effusus]|nr:hypothetical protein LUZ60_016370 [Juncus effusus]
MTPPETNTKSFDVNMATILIILACAAILAFSLHAVVRLFLRLLSLRSSSSPSTKPKHELNQTNEPSSSPVIFSSDTKLARAESDCAICLSEFVNGERIRVLPACGHGFHASCVEEWIVKHSSCPTCRATCSFPVVSPEEP